MKKAKPEEQEYNIIDHEADIGLEVYGKSLEELFINAVKGLFSLIVDAKDVKAEKGKRFDLTGNGDLLVVFLNELLKMWDAEGFIPNEFSIKIENGKLTGSVIGGVFDPAKHTARHEVRAITYDELFIEEDGKSFKTRIILDV